MKIAVSGKGGAGKTTVAGVMARILGDRGRKVIAIDADPDSNLASAIGIDEESLRDVKPLAAMDEFIAERTGAKKGRYGAFFQLNPRVDDIPERFSLVKDGVKLLVLGSIPQGGGGCFCAENALLRSLLSYVMIERDEYVIVDLEAGLEHLGRGTTEYIDALIVVVEPGKRSFQTARQVRRLADDIGIKKVYVVGNKIADGQDEALVRENLDGLPLLGFLSLNDRIIEADKRGVSPYDLSEKVREEVTAILDSLEDLTG
ncbi:MAG: Light-independent protochlorophyllide reductase iron-sulfur ATP-binding protein [Syntrophorhabdus sp. PtaB.Bin047]|jgi:CO dehydrogenase maturation factor|nr:MAG: Light-independent protochlorophyllide reductase iron-sulfur ATP-binding protein [Syntrophorhabdus sp. PtaB.Bin047]